MQGTLLGKTKSKTKQIFYSKNCALFLGEFSHLDGATITSIGLYSELIPSHDNKKGK